MPPQSRGCARADRRSRPARTSRRRAPLRRAAVPVATESPRYRAIAAASASTSPGGTSRPFSPSVTISGTPPTRVAITGVPSASDSTTPCGKFSQAELSTIASAPRRYPSTPSREAEPTKRTRSPSSSSSRNRSRRARSGPSPTTTRRAPSTRASAASASVEILRGRQPAREDERRPGRRQTSARFRSPRATRWEARSRAPREHPRRRSRP